MTYAGSVWGDKAPLPEHIEIQIKTEQHKSPIYQFNYHRFFGKFELETSILPAKRSAAAHTYHSQQNNAFEPITELYPAIIKA